MYNTAYFITYHTSHFTPLQWTALSCPLRTSLHKQGSMMECVFTTRKGGILARKAFPVTLHTAHYTLHTAHYSLHTAYCILHTTHYTLHTTHCTLHTAHYTLQTKNFTLHTASSILCSVHCIILLECARVHSTHASVKGWSVYLTILIIGTCHTILWQDFTAHYTLHSIICSLCGDHTLNIVTKK